MPKALIEHMKSGYSGSGLSEDEVNHRVYGALNNMGYMHGSKETSKGMDAEGKYKADHSSKSKLVKSIRRKRRLEKKLSRSS